MSATLLFAAVWLPLAQAAPAPARGARAAELNRELLVIDTHVDTPTFALEHPGWVFTERNADSHADLPRLIDAGLDAPFLVVYTPSRLEPAEALLHALSLVDLVHGWAEASEGRLVIARSPAEVMAAKENGRIAAVLCMENASPILPGRLDLLRNFYRLGVRYISLAHFRTNELCDSATDEPRFDGVSAFGRRVIEEANRLGMLLDVSHVSDDAVRDYLRYSEAPIIASHSNARALCDHPRNLPDDLLRAIAAGGGVIQLNFAASYVSQRHLDASEKRRADREALERELAERPAELAAALAEFDAQAQPVPRPALDEWFDHVAHVVKLVGVEHVGLGSDFDGVSATPAAIDDVTSLAAVTAGFLERNWSVEDLRRFYGGNLLRVWRQAELVAEELRHRARRGTPAPATPR